VWLRLSVFHVFVLSQLLSPQRQEIPSGFYKHG